MALARVRTPDLLLQDAILKIDAKQYPEARKSLHEVMKSNPSDLRALRFLVTSYTAQNQLHAAVEEVRAQAVAAAPSSVAGHSPSDNRKERGRNRADKLARRPVPDADTNVRPTSSSRWRSANRATALL